jgi:hypothetical protein
MFWVLLLLHATPGTAASQPVEDRTHVVKNKPAGDSFYQLLDEVLEETARDIAKLAPEDISPIAIGAVHVSPNLSTELEETIVLRLTAMLAQQEGLKQVHCASCFSVRSRLEGGEWVMTRGIVGREDMRKVATELGVKTFISVGLEFIDGEYQYLALNTRIISAKTSGVIYAKRLLSNETEIFLARVGKKRLTPEQRRAELEEMIEGKPRYGHQVMAAYTFVARNSGDGSGAALGYRLFESFGPKRSLQYGLQIQLFVGAFFGGNVAATFDYILRPENTMIPRVRFGVDAGASFVIPDATFAFGVFTEMITHLGLGVHIGGRFMVPTQQLGAAQFTIGGVWAWE